MITFNSLYWMANIWALSGWLVLFLYPVLPARAVLFAGICMPIGLSLAYLGSLCFALPFFSGGFGSIESLSRLYQNPVAVLAGWTHYLAFDLFLGGWQVRRAMATNLPVTLVVPCLFLTLVFGPVGLLFFFAVQWWSSNEQGTIDAIVGQSGRMS